MSPSMRPMCGATILVLAIGAAARAQTPQTLVLPCTRDNTMFESLTGTLSNGIGPYMFVGRTGQGAIRRGLVRFDTAAIPPGATILSAEMRLIMNQTTVGPRSIRAHRLLKSWGEGSSTSGDPGGTGAQSRTGDATWLHRSYLSVFWSAPGATSGGIDPDFIAAPSASLPVDQLDAYIWTGAGIVADVQLWTRDPSKNNGWILIGEENRRSAKRFGSRENELEGARPRLTVTYTVVPCEANCDGSTTAPFVNALDFACFLRRYQAGDPYANCDGSTTIPTLNAMDFACYLGRFAAGCP